MTLDDLAGMLNAALFAKPLQAWGCDYVRDTQTGKPWVAKDVGTGLVYVGVKGRSHLIEEAVVGKGPVGEDGVDYSELVVLMESLWNAAKRADEFPPFYVE
jgi:hypothetical protein